MVYIHQKVRRFLKQGQSVISVDTKKKELVGDFKNGGRELRLKGDPEQVRVHDFVIPELGRVTHPRWSRPKLPGDLMCRQWIR